MNTNAIQVFKTPTRHAEAALIAHNYLSTIIPMDTQLVEDLTQDAVIYAIEWKHLYIVSTFNSYKEWVEAICDTHLLSFYERQSVEIIYTESEINRIPVDFNFEEKIFINNYE